MNNNNLPDQLFFKPRDLAKIFCISPKTIYGWIEQGKLDAVKIGGRAVRIPRQEAIKLIKEINV